MTMAEIAQEMGISAVRVPDAESLPSGRRNASAPLLTRVEPSLYFSKARIGAKASGGFNVQAGSDQSPFVVVSSIQSSLFLHLRVPL